MASEDLLKKAVAAFNALSPEQQAEMLEDQRQSWVRGNIGLSRDERGMTSPVMPRPAPAATDTGLVTVGEVSTVRESVAAFAGHMLSRKLKPGDLLCLRSQAEELLAAVRAEHDNTIATLTSLITDNAAKAARIKELEKINADLCRSHGVLNVTGAKLEGQVESLEAKLETYHEEYENRKEGYEKTIDSLEEKLAAAEKALEFYADASKWNDGYFKSEDDGTVLRAYPSSIEKDHGDKARAVLGGKP